MKKILIALLLCLPVSVFAQEDYEMGSYWTVTGVETKPGKFEAYVGDLKSLWRKEMEMLMAAGKIKSYKLFTNVHGRQGEPTMWMMVEWSSAGAMMDTPYEEWAAMTEELVGSMDESRDLSIKRGELRTIMGDTLLREFAFR